MHDWLRICFVGNKSKLKAFVADEHFHRLYGDGADSIREVFEHRIFEHFDCLLRIPKPSFRILNRLSVFVVDDNLRLLDFIHRTLERRRNRGVR